MNKKVESLFSKRITELEITPLRNEDEQQTVITEIHDELGGLFLAQPFLGQAEDTKTTLAESFNWFEHPALVESLFNLRKHNEKLSAYRKEFGFRKWWRKRGDIRRLTGTLKTFSKLLRSKKVLAQLLASHYMRRSLNPTVMEYVDLKKFASFCAAISQQLKYKKAFQEGVNLATSKSNLSSP